MVFGISMGRWMVAGLLCWLGLAGPGMAQGVPLDLQARILQREDERNSNGRELTDLLQSPVPAVRERVALALGRIGDRRTTPDLLAALERERVDAVRRMIVFALGEIEDPRALEPLLRIIGTGTYSAALRARAAEALGKLPEPLDRAALTRQLLTLLSALLPVATATLTDEQAELASLVVTALTRLRAPEAVGPLASLLKSTRTLVRAAAANGLARLRQPLTAVVDELIVALGDADPEVRANAARALGVARDKRAAVPLTLLLHDRDERVVVSAVRALGMLPESKPAASLLELGQGRLVGLKDPRAPQTSLLCELATVLGTLRDPQALPFLTGLRRLVGIGASPEVETALAAFGGEHFYSQPVERMVDAARRHPGGIGNLAKGMAIVGDARSRETLLWLWGSEPGRSISRPELLRALARLKPQILPSLIGQALTEADPVGQAVAAELMAGLEPAVARGLVPALLDGWRRAPNGANDGQLAILRALARTQAPEARKVLEEALAHPDYLVRRLAAELLGRDPARVAIVATGRTLDHYRRIVQRLGRVVDREVAITLRTTRGVIELELFPREAPLTVDNLVSLVRRGYFSGITFHRVVPNFVIQGGDPRGDGEGGPGYQIRCEVNYRTYGRGTLGMALSGKDTGGSQFFITHSAQPHLDGGYTVFGQVRKGMEVVDQITRGDLILEATVAGEASRPARGRRRVK